MRLPSFKPFLLALVLLSFPSFLFAHADEIQWQKIPIQTHWSFGQMDYSLNGQKLKSLRDLSKPLLALNDPRTNQLLAHAADTHRIGNVGRIIAGLGIGWGGLNLLFTDSPSTHSKNLVVFFAGVGINLLAGLLMQDSHHAEYNAVQRYNLVVRGEDSSLPPAPKDEKSLLPSSP